MGRQSNPLTNPLHYAAKQPTYGPPVAAADAERIMPNYDYGMFISLGESSSHSTSKLTQVAQ